MSNTNDNDDFLLSLFCGMFAADDDFRRWSWRDFAVYLAAGIAAAVSVGIVAWIFCR